MMDQIQRLLDEYTSWLRDSTNLRQIGEWIEITTPFLDRHNDSLQIYAEQTAAGLRLTDDGYILQDLQASGLEFNSTKRRDTLNTALRGFGVQLEGQSLVVVASPAD